MRRIDREIINFDEVIDVLRRADTIRLGLHGESFPYVVPLSYGFEVCDDKILLYFHGANVGYKHDLIVENPCVCVETDIFHRYAEVSPDSFTVEYESFIGFGRVEQVLDEEAAKGMSLLLLHCGFSSYPYNRSALESTAVYRITVDSFTGKRRFINR